MSRLRRSGKNISDRVLRASEPAAVILSEAKDLALGALPANSGTDEPSWVETKMATKVTGILGKKVGMTQLFDSKGDVRPVTVLQAGPCVITQHKSATRDGYEAAQIGLVEFVKESRLTKPARGHLAKNNLPPVKFMREVPLETDGAADSDVTVKVGDRVLVEIFEGEKFVDIVGVSKGKGFQGVVKRHHFGGGPKSHGSMFQITGSIGSSAFPSRVFKGMRMSGHMGHDRVTQRNLRVLGVDKEENLLVVEGSVPGPQGGYIVIIKAKKPPRERRGFAGSATVDPLKAAKRAAKKA
jgi:large subunit ribosomal protein L3